MTRAWLSRHACVSMASVSLLVISAVQAVGMSTEERKAVRREMIEMDVAVRNMTSIIATRDKKMLIDTLERLVTWQIKDHPQHGSYFRQMLSKWKANGSLRHGIQIQSEANALRSYTAKNSAFHTEQWQRVVTGFNKILYACQACHQMNTKESK